jgi:tRNA G18 (ribose-2'-O)-methylase SpoU
MPAWINVPTTAAAAVGFVVATLWWRRAPTTSTASVRLSPPRIEVVLHDVSKPRNFENILRACAALGVTRVVTIGRRKTLLEELAASHNITVERYQFFGEALANFDLAGVPKRTVLVGLEIVPDSVPAKDALAEVLARFPMCDRVLLMPGNEGKGMSALEKQHCDMFVHVPQFARIATTSDDDAAGGGGAGSLNVGTATAIALHQLLQPG